MNIGDLVSLKMKKTQPPQLPQHGIVISTGKNHYYEVVQIDVLWGDGNISTLRPDLYELYEVVSLS